MASSDHHSAESFWRRNFLKPGFIFDMAFSLAALVLTPLILRNTDAAKTGHGDPQFGSLLILASAVEAVALTIALPRVFRMHTRNSIGFMSMLLLWVAHFALQMMLAETVIMRSLQWSDASPQAQYATAYFVIKEFYIGGLIFFCMLRTPREAPVSHRAVAITQLFLAGTGFLFYTIAFEGMSHAEILEGIDTNIAENFAYKIFHFGFVFFLIYFPARLVFVVEDRLSVYSKGDRWLYRAGLVGAMICGTWALYTGPEILPSDITAREERFGQSRLMEHTSYAPLGYLERLIDAGVDVNARDHKGRTALHKAAYNGRISAVRLLLDHKANPNAATHDGLTPLMATFHPGWSGLQDRLQITRLLLMSGANPELRDQAGRKFTDYVEYQFRGHVTELLREKNTPPK